MQLSRNGVPPGRVALWAGAPLLLALLSGCTVQKHIGVEDEQLTELAALPHGTPEADVVAKFGEPQGREIQPDGSIELVYASAVGSATVGLFGSSDEKIATKSVRLRFVDGKLVREQAK